MNEIIEWLYNNPGVNVSFYRSSVSSFVEIEMNNGYEYSDNGGAIKHTVSKIISLNAPNIEDEIINILDKSYAKLASLKMNNYYGGVYVN